MSEIKPELYGLSKRVVLEKIDENHIALVIDRKSRIIMKDCASILTRVHQIKSVDDKCLVSLKTSAPVCSKTKACLGKEGIAILPL